MFHRQFRRSSIHRGLVFAVLGVLLVLMGPGEVVSAQPPQDVPKSHDIIPGTTGVDISWPQCPGNVFPADVLSFAIIGVNGGRMTTYNECLRSQFEWAKSAPAVPQVYMNTNAPRPDYVHPECHPDNAYCHAYNYGRTYTAAALEWARANDADSANWWLDVETANFWTNHTGFNAQVLAGAIHVLQESGHRVGIYSIPRMWREIAGDYAPGLPVWTAGAADLQEAKTRCHERYAFGGGKVVLVQYVSEEFDTNWACPGTPTRRLTVIGAASGIAHAEP